MFVVERAEGKDEATVLELANASMKERFEVGWWHQHVQQGDCFVARDTQSRKVLGFAVAEQDDACEAHLAALGVEANQRGRGVGTALLKTLQSNLGRSGVFRIHLEVRADDQQAQEFYMRHGYEPEGVHDHAYSDGASAVRLSRPV